MKDDKNKLSFVYVAIFAIFCAVSIVYMNYTSSKNGEVSDLPLVQVYVKGEVNNPGVYEMNVTDRVHDAIEKAGGMTETADVDSLELARFLEDGETIFVPSAQMSDNDNVSAENNFYGARTNINTASKEQIATLDGIGENLAERIVAYREKNGKFGDVNDLLNVSGIGKKKLEIIKDNICVE